MDDNARNALMALGYVAVGAGLAGGWKHWGAGARVLYVVLFPLHALLGSLARDLWKLLTAGASE